MLEILNPLDVSLQTWLITALCAMITGLSKSGLKGFAMVNIPILAYLYGGKLSVAILLPFLVAGDIFAILYYRKNINFSHTKRLMPWAAIGLIIATFIGKYINDHHFKIAIACAILICLAIIIYRDIKGSKLDYLTNSKIFSRSLGISGGFATMIGNAAGPIFNLYLMGFRLPKNIFIATEASFYLILNLVKVPIQYFYWDTISNSTLLFNLILLPFLLTGAFIGKSLVKLIPEKPYRIFIIVVTGFSAVMLFL